MRVTVATGAAASAGSSTAAATPVTTTGGAIASGGAGGHGSSATTLPAVAPLPGALRELLDLGRSILWAAQVQQAAACRKAEQAQARLVELVQSALALTAAEWPAFSPRLVTGAAEWEAVFRYVAPPFVALHYGPYRCFIPVSRQLCESGLDGAEAPLTLHYSWALVEQACTRENLAVWVAHCQAALDTGEALPDVWAAESGAVSRNEQLYAELAGIHDMLDSGELAQGQARTLAMIAEILLQIGADLQL